VLHDFIFPISKFNSIVFIVVSTDCVETSCPRQHLFCLTVCSYRPAQPIDTPTYWDIINRVDNTTILLQKDLDTLTRWAQTWLINFK